MGVRTSKARQSAISTRQALVLGRAAVLGEEGVALLHPFARQPTKLEDRAELALGGGATVLAYGVGAALKGLAAG